jgi:hypothetical protein
MRLRFAVALGLGLVAALALNLSIAFADGWFWNAKLAFEGVETRTVWSVTDDPDGADYYRAQIWVIVPYGAAAEVLSQMTDAERVHIIETKHLSCRADGVEALAAVRVHPTLGADGTNAQFDLVANGAVVASASGGVREFLYVSTFLPTAGNPSCWSGG